MLRRRKVWGHDTKALYDKLSKADKKMISAYLRDIARGHRDYLLMYSQGMAFDGTPVAQRASNIFNKGRYWSDLDLPNPDDKGFVSNAGVGNLSDAIRKLILELRPGWDEKVKGFRLKLPGHGTLPT